MIGPHLNILSGFAFNSKQFNDQGDGMPLIRIRDVGKDSSETFYSGDFDEKFIVKPGDILIGMDGDFRLAVWQGERALLNQRVCKVESKGEVIDRGYLIHMLPRELQRIEDSTSYATVKHLSVKKIKAIEMPLPPLDEQKRIAEILDEADRVRKKTQALIDKYDELAQSLFLDMFGDDLKSSKEDWKQIPEILFFQEGPGVRKWQFRDSGVKLLNGRNINDNKIDLSTTSIFVSNEEAYGKYSHFLAEEGDLVIACSGVTLDRFHKKVALLKAQHLPLCMNTSTMRFKVLDESILNIHFFRFFLGSVQFLNQLRKLITGSAQLNFGPSHVKKMAVPCPPISRQNEFAQLVAEIELEKLNASQCAQQNFDLFNALLQKAFKGELT